MSDIICADVRDGLRQVADGSVQLCVTSPPYYGLRDYGIEGQIGLEKTPELYLEHLVDIFRDVHRVLHKTGMLVVNMGDSYARSWGATSHDLGGKAKRTGTNKRLPQSFVSSKRIPRKSFRRDGADVIPGRWGGGNVQANGYYKPKDLMMMPARLAIELQKDRWFLRSMIPWIKWEMPESVEDRPSGKIEYFFLLSKSKNCYWDQEAIRIPNKSQSIKRYEYPLESSYTPGSAYPNESREKPQNWKLNKGGRIRRVRDWFDESFRGLYCDDGEPLALIVNSVPFPHKKLGSHFATFAPKAVMPFVLAGTSERGQCAKCGNPQERIIKKSGGTIGESWHDHKNDIIRGERTEPEQRKKMDDPNYQVKTLGWRATCLCNARVEPQTVLDPFAGSFTVPLVALRAGRRFVAIELSPDYIKIGRKRIAPLMGQEKLI